MTTPAPDAEVAVRSETGDGPADVVAVSARLAAAGRWLQDRRGQFGVVLVVLALVVAGWQRRWLCDDAFINLRVIRNLGAGNGPVFNAGERVEVTTSPLWMYLVALIHLVTRVRLEWITVLAGLATTAGAVLWAASGARRLHRGQGFEVPIGAVMFAALPIVWDWSTGGLENGLSWLWWAGAFTLTVRATVGEEPVRPWGAAVWIGLAPLVRPDLAVPGLVFGAWLLVRTVRSEEGRWARLRSVVLLAVAAGALPGLYQVFRMGYYGQLLPNTVYAKEGGMAWWSQGLTYVSSLLGSYGLWAALLVVVAVVIALTVDERSPGDGRAAMVVVSFVAAGASALLVARAGGDYMFGRLLLPALFGLLCPAMVLPVPAHRPARIVGGVAVVGLALWAIAVAGWVRPGGWPKMIGDERLTTIASTKVPHPIFVEDHVAYLEDQGVDLRHLGDDGPPMWVSDMAYGIELGPRPAGTKTAITYGAMGAVPYRLPLDVYVGDILGLADPVVAHVRLEYRSVPGHEKFLRLRWWAARLLPPDVAFPPSAEPSPILVVDPPPAPSDDPAVIAAERAEVVDVLRCGELAKLQAAYRDELTVGRFFRNIAGAPALHSFRFSRVPATARAELCGPN